MSVLEKLISQSCVKRVLVDKEDLNSSSAAVMTGRNPEAAVTLGFH